MDINEAHHRITNVVGFKGYPPALVFDKDQPDGRQYVACIYPDTGDDNSFVIQLNSWEAVIQRVKERISDMEPVRVERREQEGSYWDRPDALKRHMATRKGESPFGELKPITERRISKEIFTRTWNKWGRRKEDVPVNRAPPTERRKGQPDYFPDGFEFHRHDDWGKPIRVDRRVCPTKGSWTDREPSVTGCEDSFQFRASDYCLPDPNMACSLHRPDGTCGYIQVPENSKCSEVACLVRPESNLLRRIEKKLDEMIDLYHKDNSGV